MDKLPYSRLAKGCFLVANPDLEEGIYFRSVILLCDHSPAGSFGLIINKPLELELPEELLNTHEMVNTNVQIRAGGPIQDNQMMILHTFEELPEQSMQICDGVFLGGDLDFLQQAISNENGPAIRLCFGYSAWTSGQLEREFLSEEWFLAPATAEHIFHTPSEKLWQTILKEMGGRYASMAMIPEDLSLN